MDETQTQSQIVPVFFAEPSAFNHYSVPTLIETGYQVHVILLTILGRCPFGLFMFLLLDGSLLTTPRVGYGQYLSTFEKIHSIR